MKKFVLIFISILAVDIIISNLIFKNTKYWENSTWEKKWWRVSSPIYHHKILPNIDKNSDFVKLYGTILLLLGE